MKWLQRRLFIRQLRMDRITVAELRKLIDDGKDLLILDVRPEKVRVDDGIIPGAVPAHPTDIDPIVMRILRAMRRLSYTARAQMKNQPPLLQSISSVQDLRRSYYFEAG